MNAGKRGRIDFMRLGYMRPTLSPEVVAALVEHSERLAAVRDMASLPNAVAGPAWLANVPPTYDELVETLRQVRDEEERRYQEQRAAWQLGDYVGACPNCGRARLCQCQNGKRRCEKCNWCPEDGAYAPDV